MNVLASPRIAIIGGGPAGLTLARILETEGVSATVFERDRSEDERPQGGTLDLHVESGQYALRLAGLEREFLAVARYEDQGSRLYDSHGVLHLDHHDAEGDRPEVDRTELRRLLLRSLAPGTVRWGSRVATVEPRPDGAFAVRLQDPAEPFQDGEEFDLVVGADGAWSKVRPLLSEARPVYSGITFYDLGIDDVDARHPALAELVGRGKMFALGEGRAIIAQRNGDSHLRIAAAFPVPEARIASEIDESSIEFAREDLVRRFPGWSEALLALIRAGEHVRRWPLYALPIGHAWEHRRGVTLLGDAAHLMSPFSGEGVNLAMLDAAELALAITGGGDRDARVRGFEASMIARAEREAHGAAHGLESTFGPDALAGALEWMGEHRDARFESETAEREAAFAAGQ